MTQNCRVFTKEVADTTRKIQALSFYAPGKKTDFFKSEQKEFVSGRKSIDRDAFRPFSIQRLTIKKKTIDGRGRTRGCAYGGTHVQTHARKDCYGIVKTNKSHQP